MNYDLALLLRTLKPDKRTIAPPSRHHGQLRAESAKLPQCPIVLDTTTYIHAAKGSLPADIATKIAKWPTLHCSVAIAEIAHGLGRLDPAHPNTPTNRKGLEAILNRIPRHRIINPTTNVHITGAILSGIIARLLILPAGAHRNRINDILIFLTAHLYGAAVVTANVKDFDILQQLHPASRVIYY